MKKRIKLADRHLPTYSKGEEVMNMVTHIVGGAFGIFVLILSLIKASSAAAALSCAVYGISMISLYSVSSVYHGLATHMSKKVMQVIDHCTIYFLIAGTYTPIAICAILPHNKAVGYGIFILEWALCALAITLTAIDLKKYNVFSMICYIGLGWAILPFLSMLWDILGKAGFCFLLGGGIAYTVGAVLYGVGKKLKWMHSVFHIFVVLGSVLQFICIYFYIL